MFLLKVDILKDVFKQNKNFDRLQLGIYEFFGEFFNQLKSKTPLNVYVIYSNWIGLFRVLWCSAGHFRQTIAVLCSATPTGYRH